MNDKIKVTVCKFADQLIGKQLPTNEYGEAGRELENIIEEEFGLKLNRGKGPDWLFEIKSRKESAVSPQTVTGMYLADILKTDYKNSPVYEKFRQQLRVKTNDDNVIISAELYNFDQPQIQDLIEEAYNHAKDLLTQNSSLVRTSYAGGYYGFFENCHPDRPNYYSFRFNDADMRTLEEMTNTTFSAVFDYS